MVILMNKLNYEYKSVFKEDIERFLKEKELILSPVTIFNYSSVLKSFDIWCIENNVSTNTLSYDVVNRWILQGCETKSHKVSVMRELAKNIEKYGKDSYIIPKKLYRNNEKHIPYIFSDQEIIKFINFLETIKPMRGFNYRKETFSLIFKMLIFTGARKSDILNLKIADIDFDKFLVYIHNGKNDINRIIPINNSLINELKKYKELLGNSETINDYFFSNISSTDIKRKRVSETSLFEIFRMGLEKINVPYKNRKEGPRIHDFRFTFIVKSIQKLVKENKDLNVYLPLLSKYVGHTTFSDTLYYFKPKELIFLKENYQTNSLIPNLSEEDFDE